MYIYICGRESSKKIPLFVRFIYFLQITGRERYINYKHARAFIYIYKINGRATEDNNDNVSTVFDYFLAKPGRRAFIRYYWFPFRSLDQFSRLFTE